MDLTEIILTVVLVVVIALTIGVYRWIGVYTRALRTQATVLADYMAETSALLFALQTRDADTREALRRVGLLLDSMALLTEDSPID